jgi:transposase
MKYAINTLLNEIYSLQEIIILLQNNVEKMAEEKNTLQQKHDAILQEKIKTDAELATVRLKLDHLLEQFKLSKQRQFGRSSEKDLIQHDIFDEAGVTLPVEAAEDVAEETEVITYERKKKNTGKAKRRALPDYLPREVKTYDIPESEKTCACCGSEKTCFSKNISEQLKVIPPQIVVISHQRLKYCCKSCEAEISIAPKPDLFLPKSIADASLVAYTIILKYVDHLPLYRQEHIWARNKIDLPRNTTCAWVMKSATLCEPLVNVMRLELIKSGYVQADETPTQVLCVFRPKSNTDSGYRRTLIPALAERFRNVHEITRTT